MILIFSPCGLYIRCSIFVCVFVCILVCFRMLSSRIDMSAQENHSNTMYYVLSSDDSNLASDTVPRPLYQLFFIFNALLVVARLVIFVMMFLKSNYKHHSQLGGLMCLAHRRYITVLCDLNGQCVICCQNFSFNSRQLVLSSIVVLTCILLSLLVPVLVFNLLAVLVSGKQAMLVANK